jgi:hypothetical protein
MVVGAYIEWHSFLCHLRDRRCAIERLGVPKATGVNDGSRRILLRLDRQA